MIPFLDFLKPVEMGLKVFLLYEGRAVDPLKHGQFLVSAPVGAGHAEEFEGLYHPRGNRVRASAEVHEFALAVERDGLAFGQFFQEFFPCRAHPYLGKAFLADSLSISSLTTGRFSETIFFISASIFSEVLGSEGSRYVKIVVEPVLDGRADRQLRLGAQTLHGLGEDVRRSMPERPPGPFVVERERHNAAASRSAVP